MLFNSLAFCLFFPLVTILYYQTPHRFRWALLLAASCYFYMFFIPYYMLILAFTIIVDYAAGVLIEGAAGERRKMFLALSMIANVGALCVFKYYNFFIDNVSGISAYLGWHYTLPMLSIALPIGLSFHTFQAMSYTIEVYRGNQKAERHFGIYALYVMFYPQLVAGPIERPQNLLPQFHREHTFDPKQAISGLKLMAWGLFKKAVVADRLALGVNTVFSHAHGFDGPPLAIATLFFAAQIYCDFSGYSDIAIGSARVMGIELMTNFRQPYHSASIAEFWRRWHISLSTWFKDYVYIPLGGSKTSHARWAMNIMIVFTLSGLWHGANWTYVVWGALHGMYLIIGRMTASLRRPLSEGSGSAPFPLIQRALNTFVVFTLVCIGWIFFRCSTVGDAWYILRNLGGGWSRMAHVDSILVLGKLMGYSGTQFALCFFGIGAVECFDWLDSRVGVEKRLSACNWAVRWTLYYALGAAIVFWGIFGQEQFIYFQF